MAQSSSLEESAASDTTQTASTDSSVSQTTTETSISSQDEKLITEDKTLTAKETDYQVAVDVTADAKLPEDVALKVDQVKTEDDSYQSDLQKTQDALSTTDLASVHLYNISLVKDDAEVEPSAPVTVTITPTQALFANKDNLKVIHIKDDGTTEVLDADVTGDTNQVTKVTFDSNSFSDFALIGTNPTASDTSDSSSSSTSADTETESATETDTTPQSYTVTFYNDDSEITSTQIEARAALATLPENPFKSGYRFDHWENADTGETVTAETVVNGNLKVKAVFTEISIYTVTVNYYYHNNSSGKDVTFDIEIFQIEEKDTPYQITPPASTEVEKEMDTSLTADAIYYPQEAIIELKSGDLATKDADDGSTDSQVTINLQYVPYTAEYDVHYMLKDLTGNGYSEIQKVNNHGVLGSTVSPQVLTYDYATFEKTDATKIDQAKG